MECFRLVLLNHSVYSKQNPAIDIYTFSPKLFIKIVQLHIEHFTFGGILPDTFEIALLAFSAGVSPHLQFWTTAEIKKYTSSTFSSARWSLLSQIFTLKLYCRGIFISQRDAPKLVKNFYKIWFWKANHCNNSWSKGT